MIVNMTAMMRRESRSLLDRARYTKDKAKKTDLLHRALELAVRAESLERQLQSHANRRAS
jgi:hypothetical protein